MRRTASRDRRRSVSELLHRWPTRNNRDPFDVSSDPLLEVVTDRDIPGLTPFLHNPQPPMGPLVPIVLDPKVGESAYSRSHSDQSTENGPFA